MSYFFKAFFISFCFLNPIFAANEPGITIPLHYHPQYGIYTATLKVAQDPAQEIEAIVDTGSSSLVFIADSSYCPSCSQSLTKGAINPSKLKGYHQSKAIPLSYGSANDIAIEFIAPIQYTDQHALTMKIFVLKHSNQPSSILGMIHHNLRDNLVQFIPFLTKLTDHFSKYSELTFVLCADKGNSYFHVGSLNLPKPLVSTKLLDSPFYEIHTSGFYTQDNKPIATPNNQIGRAILDTGTGGFILLTPDLNQSLHHYIYQNAGPKNQKLHPKFWQKNYCVMEKKVDFKSLPTINIGIQILNGKDFYHLSIPPTTYINQAGCGEGYVRFVFIQGLPPNHPTAIRNHQARKAKNVAPDMVIGTSLLSHYALQIHYKKNPRVTFYNNQTLCSQ